MDQVRTMVDNGDVLNYDACVQHPRVWGLAAADRVPGDDPGLNQTRYKLCTNFFKTGSWRGGIAASVDDRKDTVANDWTPERRAQFVRVRDDIVGSVNNFINVVKQRSIPAALEYPGAANEVQVAKATIDTLLTRLASERRRITGYTDSLQKQQNVQLVEEVAETELKVRKIEQENEQFRKAAELREGQVSDVYKKYDSNYHTSVFGYAPHEWSHSSWYGFMPYSLYINLSPTSRTGILFMAFFFAFAAIIAVAVRVWLYYSSSKIASVGLAATLASNMGAIGRAMPPLPQMPEAIRKYRF